MKNTESAWRPFEPCRENVQDAALRALYEAGPGCRSCGAPLLFSARQRRDGLCGPCSREAR